MKPLALFAFALCIAMLPASTPAHSQMLIGSSTGQAEVLWDWWFVYAGGASPQREVIYIDSLSVENVTDHAAIMNTDINVKMKKFPIAYVQADGVLISEDKTRAARTAGRVRAKCETQEIMFEESDLFFWDTDRGVEHGPASPWLPAGNDLRYSQILKFMCDPKARTDKNMMMRADQSSDPLNTTWDIIWKDVKKPEFTTKKSREQIDAEFDAIMARAKQQNTEATADAQKRLEGYDKESEFMASVRKTFQSKDKKFHTLFYSMPGWDEAQINTAWGAPLNAGWQGSTRVLTYYYQDTVYDQVEATVDIIKCQGGGCGKVGETTETKSVARTANCERYLYLRPGGSKDGLRLVDYSWTCF